MFWGNKSYFSLLVFVYNEKYSNDLWFVLEDLHLCLSNLLLCVNVTDRTSTLWLHVSTLCKQVINECLLLMCAQVISMETGRGKCTADEPNVWSVLQYHRLTNDKAFSCKTSAFFKLDMKLCSLQHFSCSKVCSTEFTWTSQRVQEENLA